MNTESKNINAHLADNSGQAVSRTAVVEHRRSAAAALVAGLLAAMGSSPFMCSKATARTRKPVPLMVCSPPAEIAAWNADVDRHKAERAERRGDFQSKQDRRVIVRAVGIRQHKQDVRANRAAYRAA